jgi:hypothetical protein
VQSELRREIPLPADDVVASLTDPNVLVAHLAAAGAVGIDVLEAGTEDGGRRMRVRAVLPVYDCRFPLAVRAGGTLAEWDERWQADAGGTSPSGTWRSRVAVYLGGIPVHVRGTITVRSSGRHPESGTADVVAAVRAEPSSPLLDHAGSEAVASIVTAIVAGRLADAAQQPTAAAVAAVDAYSGAT